MALTPMQAGAPPEHRPAHHPIQLMKHFILIASLLFAALPLNAGWFSKDPPPPPPDLGPEYRSKISKLEEQMSEQHVIADRWKIATGSLACGALLLFVIGTALGAKTRQHYDGTTRMGRTVPTTTPPAPNGARHHMGEAGPPDRHPTMAA
jgi:hypothetical protein